MGNTLPNTTHTLAYALEHPSVCAEATPAARGHGSYGSGAGKRCITTCLKDFLCATGANRTVKVAHELTAKSCKTLGIDTGTAKIIHFTTAHVNPQFNSTLDVSVTQCDGWVQLQMRTNPGTYMCMGTFQRCMPHMFRVRSRDEMVAALQVFLNTGSPLTGPSDYSPRGFGAKFPLKTSILVSSVASEFIRPCTNLWLRSCFYACLRYCAFEYPARGAAHTCRHEDRHLSLFGFAGSAGRTAPTLGCAPRASSLHCVPSPSSPGGGAVSHFKAYICNGMQYYVRMCSKVYMVQCLTQRKMPTLHEMYVCARALQNWCQCVAMCPSQCLVGMEQCCSPHGTHGTYYNANVITLLCLLADPWSTAPWKVLKLLMFRGAGWASSV